MNFSSIITFIQTYLNNISNYNNIFAKKDNYPDLEKGLYNDIDIDIVPKLKVYGEV